MKCYLLILAMFISSFSYGQKVVYDKYVFSTVNANGAVRQAAEATNHRYYDKVNDNLEKIQLNASTIILAQDMIFRSLSNVNSALRNGRMVLAMSNQVERIVTYSNYMVNAAKEEPYLLLFAEQSAQEVKTRSLALITDVSEVILKEGENMMMDYNARDELLKKVSRELSILAGLTYSGYSMMMSAKRAGVLKRLNPYSGYINQDVNLAGDIARKFEYLKKP
jgi:hypothetical protein